MIHDSSCGCPDCEEFHPNRFDSVGQPTDAHTVRQEVEKRAYKAYFDDQAQTSGEIVKSMADFALAERQRVWEKAAKIAEKNAIPHIGCVHDSSVASARSCHLAIADAIRSQAAKERGEPHAKS